MSEAVRQRVGRALLAGLGALVMTSVPAQAQEAAASSLRAELAPLEFLAGSCWHGIFPDGAAYDVHCFAAVYGGQFLRDVHAVPHGEGVYRGETLYHWDEAGQVIRYRYYNSIGGVSDGTARLEGGVLRFPDEVHRSEAGSERVIASSLQRLGEDSYLAVSADVTGETPVELFRMRFQRISQADAEALVEGGF